MQAGGDLEQSIGGIETLFKDSADIVISNAEKAYMTAGVNANDYMQQVTSFSASLLQSLDGDTTKAAAAADMAIIDMADNANKMGSTVESIQTAYQGFAKQNYTMLDNLKLGYGGTKTEMERLLSDASKLSGVKYDITNLNDVYSAIHVIQGELEITGTTAKEGMTTLTGATTTAKAAWDNFMSGAGDTGPFIDAALNLVDVVVDSLMELLPRLTTGLAELASGLLPKIPKLFATLLPAVVAGGSSLLNSVIEALPAVVQVITDALPQIVEAFLTMAPLLLQAGADIISSLLTGIGAMLPTLIPAAVETIMTLVQGLVDNIPMLADGALQLLEGLAAGITTALPIIVAALPGIIDSIVSFLTENLPIIIETGTALLVALVEDLPAIINGILSVLPELIGSLVDALLGNLPVIIQAGIDLFLALVEALPEIIQGIVTVIPEIISAVVSAVLDNLPAIIDAGVQLFIALIENLPTIIIEIVKAVPQIIEGLVSAFTSLMPKIVEVGGNLIKGIWNGINDAAAWLRGKISGFFGGVVDSIKDFFGIKSPSTLFRDEIGAHLPTGIAAGIEKSMPKLTSTVMKMSTMTYKEAKAWIEKYQKSTNYLASEEVKMWELLTQKYVAGSKERAEIDKKLAAAKAKQIKEEDAARKQQFENDKFWINMRKELGLTSLADEVKAWEAAQKKYAAGTKERIEADKQLAASKKALADKVADINKQMEAAEQSYQDALLSRTQAIYNSFGLFDEVAQQTADHVATSGADLTNRLQDQIAEMELFTSNMAALTAAGVDEALLAELRAMGPAANEQLTALTNMTDEELVAYVELWKKKMALAKKQAEDELKALRESTNATIAGLMSDLNKTVTAQSSPIGAGMMQGILQGVKDNIGPLREGLKEAVQGAMAYAMESIDIATGSTSTKTYTGFGASDSGVSSFGVADTASLTKSAVVVQPTAPAGNSLQLNVYAQSLNDGEINRLVDVIDRKFGSRIP